MNFATPINTNYAATVVALKDFVILPNCDNVKAALVFGNSIIVSKTATAGEVGLFFPAESQLSKEFLGANNLYRKAEFGNVDATQTGYFEQHGRIKTMRFRGNKSEGFWIPISSLAFTGVNLTDFNVGDVFDTIGTIEICRKYVPKGNSTGTSNTQRSKVAKLIDSIVENQFRWHFDTENFRRNSHKIKPTDIISISDKHHGTSAVFANVIVKKNLNWFEKLLTRFGVAIQDTGYGFVHSSRKVVKGVDGVDKSNNLHFYGTDLWGITMADIKDRLPKGYTVYGEIVGYTPTGGAIQAAPGGKPYHYGCATGTHKLEVYRVTNVNPDGKIIELAWFQMREFCARYGFEMVKELFYGPVTELVPYDNTMDIRDWQDSLLKYLEATYVYDQDCTFNPGLPAEGIVIRVDRLEEAESFKLKNFRFLESETKLLDAGVVDTETQESEA